MAQIKKDTSLRKAILQAAITGQLISSCHSELDSESAETGKELLDKIIEERNNKLLAEWEEKQTDLFASNDTHSKNAKTVRSEQIRLSKKIKKPEPIVASEIDEDEIPFEIPENWCWCRLGDIIDLLSGRDLEPSAYNSISKGIPYMTGASNFNNEELIVNRWTDKPATISNLGDLLITCKGTIGELAFNHVGDVHIARQIMAIRKTEYINLKFLKFFLMSRIDEIQKHAKSMIPGISREDMLGFEFPLPPLSVQNAIVAKLEQVLPLVDAYENALLQKEELKNALPDKIKKAILQEAITGQLTENWRKSATIKESGKQLLYRIIEERNAKALADWEEALKKNPKAKKPVPVVASEIDEEEIPFEVPESWCWCHLGEIFKVTMGQSPEGSNVGEEKEGMEFHQGKIFFTDKYIATSNQKTSEITKIAEPGSILLCMRAPVGKVNITDRQICIGRGLSSIVPLGEIALEWAFHLFETLESDFIDKSTGSTFKAITGDVVKEQLIPLPPLAEQKVIVKKLEELLPLCKY